MVKKTPLQIWEDDAKALRERMPKVCGNCRHEGHGGVCVLHDSTPPADFAETPSACPDWVEVVPF
jgi:hypothetical protein